MPFGAEILNFDPVLRIGLAKPPLQHTAMRLFIGHRAAIDGRAAEHEDSKNIVALHPIEIVASESPAIHMQRGIIR
jgi:hypothetical protein